jgi:FAD/FMN-containing dehydrogenase
MNNDPRPMANPPKRHRIKSYSGYYTVEPWVYEPSSLEELRELVSSFNRTNTRFSVAGGFYSFDNQCQNSEAVISCKNINHIRLDLANKRVVAGAGATWERILAELVPHGYLMYIAPTGGKITIGGSISSDSYSRFTPGVGRESRFVRSLTILTTEGELIKCDANTHADLYFAVIGGLGIVVIICEVEFEVLYVGKNPALCTVGYVVDGIQLHYAKAEENLPEHEGKPFPGAGLVLYSHKGVVRTVITKHYWRNTTERKTSLVHQRRDMRRILGGVLLRLFPKLSDLMWEMYRKGLEKQPLRQISFIEEPENVAFFMDAEWKSKQISSKIGISTAFLQQGFIVPCFDGDESPERITEFSRYLLAELSKHGVKPAMMDIIFLPKGDHNAFSAKPHQSAYLISIAVEGKAIPSYQAIYDLFADFSAVCHKQFQGKVHLVKNILCPPELLRTMYEAELAQVLQVKAQYDPKGLLQTEFFAKHFGLESMTNVPINQ